MAYQRILIDTCSYLRIAKSIQPLLGVPFGTQNYALYIIPEIKIELDRKNSFKSIFYWLKEDEYITDRKKVLSLRFEERTAVDNAYDFIWDYQNESQIGLSREDVYCLAAAYQLNLTLVTDDNGIKRAAKEYSIKTINSLELLKLMLDCGFIDIDKVDSVVSYLIYISDFPASFRKQFPKLFNKPLP